MRQRLLAGAALAGLVAAAARRTHSLTPDGAVAATLVGAAVYAGTGLRGSSALITFFASSAMLGRLPGAQRLAQQKGRERDAWQVLANGGIPALSAIAMLKSPDSQVYSVCFGGAVAAATADTWATEIGSRFGGRPWSVTTMQRLEPGISGGVTLVGLAASLVGAATISAITATPDGPSGRRNGAVAILAGGVAGSLVDSVLGATLQEVRFCEFCQRETELRVHSCGHLTRHTRGYTWCTNDVVNALALAGGGTMASGIAVWQRRDASGNT